MFAAALFVLPHRVVVNCLVELCYIIALLLLGLAFLILRLQKVRFYQGSKAPPRLFKGTGADRNLRSAGSQVDVDELLLSSDMAASHMPARYLKAVDPGPGSGHRNFSGAFESLGFVIIQRSTLDPKPSKFEVCKGPIRVPDYGNTLWLNSSSVHSPHRFVSGRSEVDEGSWTG